MNSTYSYDNKFPVSDNFLNLINELLNFETFVYATPVYWYSMSGLMKTCLDRLTGLKKQKKETGRKFKNKLVLLLVAGPGKEIPVGFEITFKLTSEYFGMSYEKHIYFSTTYIKTENEPIQTKGNL